ncbi:MAG TPA: 50S ribosomal protein L25 [Candidatus Methylacidiphilales bacterium]
MAKTISLKASVRAQVGRNAIKSLRNAGRIPGVIYGKKGTHPVSIDKKELKDALLGVSSENVLVDLQFSAAEGKSEAKFVFLQEVQHDPLANTITHVDLHEIAADEELHVDVPVLEIGEPVGVAVNGGLLDTVLRRLHVACLPKNLPEAITVDVSKLEIGQAVHVGDITLPEGVRVLNPKDQIIAVVHAPKTEEEEKAATTTEAAKEPEVIKEKKPAEGEAAEAKDAKKK